MISNSSFERVVVETCGIIVTVFVILGASIGKEKIWLHLLFPMPFIIAAILASYILFIGARNEILRKFEYCFFMSGWIMLILFPAIAAVVEGWLVFLTAVIIAMVGGAAAAYILTYKLYPKKKTKRSIF